ncbi:hypothetical protein C8F01DRAFT_972386 [Mycena amicta]|nr:hypothetical protein C8F01DRAFT_972386 [Mycena amicta]
MDQATHDAIIAANTTAVQKSNKAQVAKSAGRFDEAIALHREALALKVAAYSEASVQAAISLNGLGEACISAGRLPEADEALTKALKVREAGDMGGLGLGPRIDAAVTRDNLAALREAQGRFDDARALRLAGDPKDQIMCGNDKVSFLLPSVRGADCPSQLQACSACRSVFYCSKACQAQDWKKRHKPLCQGRTASAS